MQSERSKVIYSLGEKEKILFDAVKRWRPVPIETLFAMLRPEKCRGGQPVSDRRAQQMYVGAIVSSINEKLLKIGQAVRPAEPRGTYALTRI